MLKIKHTHTCRHLNSILSESKPNTQPEKFEILLVHHLASSDVRPPPAWRLLHHIRPSSQYSLCNGFLYPSFKSLFLLSFLFVIYIKTQFVTQIVIWHRLALTLLNAELLQILLCLFVYKSTYYRCFVSTTVYFMLDPHIYILQPPCFYIFLTLTNTQINTYTQMHAHPHAYRAYCKTWKFEKPGNLSFYILLSI